MSALKKFLEHLEKNGMVGVGTGGQSMANAQTTNPASTVPAKTNLQPVVEKDDE